MSSAVSYRGYLLMVLMAILAFNFVDRVALAVVLQDIKTDLVLSDTQMGFLSGIAFAFFYSILGIPIARWADRGNRVTIIAVTTVLWSAAVMLCGGARSFAQLLLIRVGVGVGEAGCIPPASSLLADYFSRSERPRAMARYMLGIPLALTIGYFGAGWLNEYVGWRKTFYMLGLPGFMLGTIAWLTLKEPRSQPRPMRTSQSTETSSQSTETSESERPQTPPPLKEVVRTLWHNVAFRHLFFCFSVWYFFGYGLVQWQPAFLIRTYGFQTGQVGLWLAGVSAIAGVGVYLGGEITRRYAAGNERLQLRICAIGFCSFALMNACAYLAPRYPQSIAALSLAALGGNMAQGPIWATIQTLVPARMRALSVALIYLFANLIGMGLGPLAAGALSDALAPRFGADSLKYALAILSPGYFWAAWHLWRAGQTVARDLRTNGDAEHVKRRGHAPSMVKSSVVA